MKDRKNIRLFEPAEFGDLKLRNRIVMAPLTRCRAGEDRVPNDLMAEYYRQRASAGLIISEGVAVSPGAVGYPDTPGIWTEDQTDGWRKVTDAVHSEGGLIVMQLWHVGRISDPVYLSGEAPVAPSAVAASGHVSRLRPKRPFTVPRALRTDEIPGIVDAYRKGAENALRAGFDGVEIHAANGYLPDQFLQSSVNRRTDIYGGPVENRARFLMEVTDAAVSVWGAGRVGVHLAPRCDSHDMGDENPAATFAYAAEQLGKKKIAFIFTREHFNAPVLTPDLKKAFGGPFIANEQLTLEQAESILENGYADAVSFGQAFIANPDLVRRLQAGTALNEPDSSTFYSGGSRGYTDYPFMN